MAQMPNWNTLFICSGHRYSDRRIYNPFTVVNNSNLEAANLTSIKRISNINFNPNDGIETKVSLNLEASEIDIADYVLVTERVLPGPLNFDVFSRWFIMDAVRQSNGMYELTLKRDVVTEFLAHNDKIANDKFYVEKGKLSEFDPLIVNDEGMSFNQIKVEEELINDEDNCGWLVGFFANDTPSTPINVPIGKIVRTTTTITAMSEATGISESILESLLTAPRGFLYGLLKIDCGVFLQLGDSIFGGFNKFAYKFSSDFSELIGNVTYETRYDHSIMRCPSTAPEENIHGIKNSLGYKLIRTGLFNAITTALQHDDPTEVFLTDIQLSSLKQYINSHPYLSYGGNTYRMTNNTSGISDHSQVVVSKGETTFFDNAVSDMIDEIVAAGADPNEYYQLEGWEMYIKYQVENYQITIIEEPSITETTLTFTIPSSHRVLDDAPYSMFAIPLNSISMVVDIGGVSVYPPGGGTTPSKEVSLRIAQAIIEALPAEGANKYLYDIQLMPYMPHIGPSSGIGFYNNVLEADVSGMVEGVDYALIKKDSDTGTLYRSAIFFARLSNFSRTINKQISMRRSNLKIESQTDFYRLCSPNYNGVFEFNLAKNGGSVDEFYVDATYKPYNPFIRVTPKFDFLYGLNYKDGRGLICGGDFSLSIVTDQWKSYELNNKTFGQLFARDIENLEFTQSQERLRDQLLVGAGTIGGTAAGAATGAKYGGGYGALFGGLLGLGAGVTGGAIDLWMGEQRRREAKDYTIDRFNLNLAAIKALPTSLTKSSALNIINKIFPFIERYTCTDEELSALTEKIEYDGMKVGRIDTISNYMSVEGGTNYFKAELIRDFGVSMDDHFRQVLNDEFMKGVYI